MLSRCTTNHKAILFVIFSSKMAQSTKIPSQIKDSFTHLAYELYLDSNPCQKQSQFRKSHQSEFKLLSRMSLDLSDSTNANMFFKTEMLGGAVAKWSKALL